MNKPFLSDRSAHWRLRFLEIARQVEGAALHRPAPAAAGLRPKARMGGFAALRRARRLAGAHGLA